MSTGDSDPQHSPSIVASCWNQIGVMGDQSCPELAAAIHCRNCSVFATAARDFLDRPAPAGYLAEWTRLLDEFDPGADFDAAREGIGVVIFRLGAEWLALRATVVVEVDAGPSRTPDSAPQQRDRRRPGEPARPVAPVCIAARSARRRVPAECRHGRASGKVGADDRDPP